MTTSLFSCFGVKNLIIFQTILSRIMRLTNLQRQQLLQFLQDCANVTVAEDGSITRVLPRGTIKDASIQYGIHRNNVLRIWKKANQNASNSGVLSAPREYKGGIKKWDRNMVRESISLCSKRQKKTIRGLSEGTTVPFTTLDRILRKEFHMYKRNNYILPYLKPEHFTHQFEFAAAQLQL